MENTAIVVKNISKRFRRYRDKGSSLKDYIVTRGRGSFEWHEVLRGISFGVRPGEAVGIIGENGSGKSTLLKLLSRIMYPDSGEIEMRGRVSALIELGAGFHPDMSGRENIYTNAAIFGLNRREIDSRLDKIIEFSGLEDAIDAPVRTYSSGMYMRLAFSVAINVDADILLVDEILAVGDAAFQAKCFNKLREIKSAGTTIVIVSHALGQIEQICDRSIWIKDGLIAAEGNPAEVNMQYLDYMGRKLGGGGKTEEYTSAEKPASSRSEDCGFPRWGSGDGWIREARIKDLAGNERDCFSTGEGIRIEFDYVIEKPLDSPVVGVGIFRNDGVQCYGTNTQLEHFDALSLKESGTVSFTMPEVPLLPGEYFVDLAIHREDGFAYDYCRFIRRFTIYSNVNDVGLLRLDHTWHIE